MGSCMNCPVELLLTLSVSGSFLNQGSRFELAKKVVFFFLRTWVLELLRLVFEAQLCHILAL